MDFARFARELDAWITREQPDGPDCDCDCDCAEAHVEAAIDADADAQLGIGAATEVPDAVGTVLALSAAVR